MHDIRIWHMKMIIYNHGKSAVHFRHNLLVSEKDGCKKLSLTGSIITYEPLVMAILVALNN